MVLQYHPDSKTSQTEKDLANKQMMVINNAYKILKDVSLRSIYDLQRSRGLYGSNAGIKGSSVNPGESVKAQNPPKPASKSHSQVDEATNRKAQRDPWDQRNEDIRQDRASAASGRYRSDGFGSAQSYRSTSSRGVSGDGAGYFDSFAKEKEEMMERLRRQVRARCV